MLINLSVCLPLLLLLPPIPTPTPLSHSTPPHHHHNHHHKKVVAESAALFIRNWYARPSPAGTGTGGGVSGLGGGFGVSRSFVVTFGKKGVVKRKAKHTNQTPTHTPSPVPPPPKTNQPIHSQKQKHATQTTGPTGGPFNHSNALLPPAAGSSNLLLPAPLPPPAPTSATALSTQFEGLVLTFARLVRAVWYKPVVFCAPASARGGGGLTLLLRRPEIQVGGWVGVVWCVYVGKGGRG